VTVAATGVVLHAEVAIRHEHGGDGDEGAGMRFTAAIYRARRWTPERGASRRATGAQPDGGGVPSVRRDQVAQQLDQYRR